MSTLVEVGGLGLTRDGRELLQGVDLQAETGEVIAVLGPNGAGKSSLLRVIAGEWTASAGRVALDGRPLATWSAEGLARRRAVMPQTESLRFGFRVEEVVAFGRLPWTGQERQPDRDVIDAAIEFAGVDALRGRLYPTLSGGERARVQLARVVAQIWKPADDRLLLLDEPTASQDLAHQHQMLTNVREFARRRVAVIVVLHDLNLALRYADRALLMHRGRVHAAGGVSEVLTPAHIREVYGIEVEHLALAGEARGWLAPRVAVRRESPASDRGSR